MYNRGDFHLHTTSSDGTFAPSEVVKFAKQKGLDIMAITDHDNIEGTKEALIEGEKLGIKVIPGIELSTVHNGESIHILGYFKDDSYKKQEFIDFLNDMILSRINRAKKIVENLDKFFDIKIDYQTVLNNSKGAVARPHIARAILSAGYTYEYQYIFDNILSKDSPAYVPNKKVSVEEGIKALKSVNAVVSLAHPVLIKKTPVEDFMKFDFDGLEAIYPLNSKENTDYFISLAKKYNKLITAGSDFHTSNPEDKKHGSVGAVSLTGEYLDNFLSKIF